ncbi:MAG: DNA-directed RNA polymerase subunit alpha [Parcubacteria group bacterium CG2_30_48_51]|nr:MAG: DNA-directed RNA polymerase subunit alpha [Parcubacteria group bacterium CG2_30_48_51]
MQHVPLPEKIVFTAEKEAHTATMELSSCFPGYGTTLGNALRRVLLSTLEGSAVTSFKIKGVAHEFSTIPGVKEDAVEIMLNLKKLRFKMHANEPVTLTMKAKGEKSLTCKDFAKDSQVEVLNPDFPVATLTSATAVFELDVVVEKGQGYVPTEARDRQKLDIGMISIDSMFNPVQKVSFKVENVRVGQMTNFDKLLLTVTTDGSLTPEEAVRESAKVLRDHVQVVIGKEADAETQVAKETLTEPEEEQVETKHTSKKEKKVKSTTRKKDKTA